MNRLITCILILSLLAAFVPAKKIGVFGQSLDIGHPKLAGSVRFDKRANIYTLTGSGYNIWFKRDEFHYLL